jgi:hypothetical protein
MSVPLDNLYDWIGGVAHDILIYRFYPHGSKNLENLIQNDLGNSNRSLTKSMTDIPVICHDQEPLNYASYMKSAEQIKDICLRRSIPRPDYITKQDIDQFWEHRARLNLASTIDVTANDQFILLHTEKNSADVEKYAKSTFVPAYWWSHAVIARDWYRYAQHDHRLYNYNKPVIDFNIYCRDASGSREYRTEFLELVNAHNLIKNCRVGDSDVPSTASATYDFEHYNQCAVDVVLETIFDDSKIYLTEKILRPIACGKPFILVSTPGSLAFLKEYGFKTFDGIINETYDTVTDPKERLKYVIAAMKALKNQPPATKSKSLLAMEEICQHNRQHFFSNKFIHQVTSELRTNLLSAHQEIKEKHQQGKIWFTERNFLSLEQRSIYNRTHTQQRKELADLLKQCRNKQRS